MHSLEQELHICSREREFQLLFSQTLVSSNGRTVDESTAKNTQGAVPAEVLRSRGPQQNHENRWLHFFWSTDLREEIGISTEI